MSSDPAEPPPPTPPSPPEPPPETEEYLDWLENQARGRRRAIQLDVLLIGTSAAGTALLILAIVLLVRHLRR